MNVTLMKQTLVYIPLIWTKLYYLFQPFTELEPNETIYPINFPNEQHSFVPEAVLSESLCVDSIALLVNPIGNCSKFKPASLDLEISVEVSALHLIYIQYNSR